MTAENSFPNANERAGRPVRDPTRFGEAMAAASRRNRSAAVICAAGLALATGGGAANAASVGAAQRAAGSSAVAVGATSAVFGARAAAAPAVPTWPSPELVGDVRELLRTFYSDRATAGLPYYLRAPEWEIDKAAAAKDPDTLWELYGGPGAACWSASNQAQFVQCAAMRLSRTLSVPYWGGSSLFDLQRGYYANEALAQMAGYFALYHAWILSFDAPVDAAYTPGPDPAIRDNKRYHRSMIGAYEAIQRDTIARMFQDSRQDPVFQTDLTRSAGTLALGYARTAQAAEELGAWSTPSARRDGLAILSGLLQRIWWEWVVTQPDGPRTAGMADLGSSATYVDAVLGDPTWAGSDRFQLTAGTIQSLRPSGHDSADRDGLWFDADFALPGEWWCHASFAPGSGDLTDCLAHARRTSLGGSRSPFGHFYGNGGCGARAPNVSAHNCGDTNLGSIAEEWLWTYAGGRAAAYILTAVDLAGDPDSPAGSIGARTYDTFDARLGYGAAGWHGGVVNNDDLEWTFNPPSVTAIRTLSAGRHDDEPQNGRFSLGELDGSSFSGPLAGDTWAEDRQEFPGAIENHVPGPHPLYGTSLFGSVLADQVEGGMSPSLYDQHHRNHVEEFDNWVWLALSAYHRCPEVPGADDPSDGSCFAFSTAHWPFPPTIRRLPLFVSPVDGSVPQPLRYLWRDPLGPGPGGALGTAHVAGSSQDCRPGGGMPWRSMSQGGGADAPYLLDEGGYAAYDSLVQGLGGLMRLLAARDPLAPVDPAAAPVWDQRRDDVIRTWYTWSHDQVSDILDAYRDDYGYLPGVENSACIGPDPMPGGADPTVWARQYATGESVATVTRRRAMGYSLAVLWYYWYDSEWLDLDSAAW